MPVALDPARLEGILARLPADDALALSAALEPAWRARERRRRARDEVLHELRAHYPTQSYTVAARLIERDWARYLAGPWRQQRMAPPPPDPGSRADCLYRATTLNAGVSLAWRALAEIIRPPAVAENSGGGCNGSPPSMANGLQADTAVACAAELGWRHDLPDSADRS